MSVPFFPTACWIMNGVSKVLKNSGTYERIEGSWNRSFVWKMCVHWLIMWRQVCLPTSRICTLWIMRILKPTWIFQGWNDDIGGTFRMLDGRWYNASAIIYEIWLLRRLYHYISGRRLLSFVRRNVFMPISFLCPIWIGLEFRLRLCYPLVWCGCLYRKWKR